MTWYAAHAILYFRRKSGQQESYPVWENIYLVSGSNSDEALEKAKECAELASGDSDGSLTWDDQPCELVFAGIRKLITVFHCGSNEEPSNGDEISYSELELPDLDSVMKLTSVRLDL